MHFPSASGFPRIGRLDSQWMSKRLSPGSDADSTSACSGWQVRNRSCTSLAVTQRETVASSSGSSEHRARLHRGGRSATGTGRSECRSRARSRFSCGAGIARPPNQEIGPDGAAAGQRKSPAAASTATAPGGAHPCAASTQVSAEVETGPPPRMTATRPAVNTSPPASNYRAPPRNRCPRGARRRPQGGTTDAIPKAAPPVREGGSPSARGPANTQGNPTERNWLARRWA